MTDSNSSLISEGTDLSQASEVMVMLHGIGGQASNFSSIMALLKETMPIHLKAINLPGYAGTESIEGDLDFHKLSVILGEVIADIGRPVHLVGHSIGGMIALEHAIVYPEQVKSLTMIGATSAFGGRDDSFKEAFLKARLAPLDQGQSMAEMAKAAAPSLVSTKARQDIVNAVEESLAEVPLHVWKQILKCLVTFNRRDDLGKVKCPTLIIAGEEDTNSPAKTLEKMAGQITDARFECLNDAGHILPLEAPEKISKILSDFIVGLK